MIGLPACRPTATHASSRRRWCVPGGVLAACAWALVGAAGLPGPSDALAQGLAPPPGAAPSSQDDHQTAGASAGVAAAVQQAPAQPTNLKTHAVVLVVGAATLAAAGALQSHLAPDICRWCDLHADGTDALNSLDRAARDALVWQHPDTASMISDVLAYGAVPAVAFGLDGWAARADGRGDAFKVDALVIGETIVLAANATELLKFVTARQRPYAHARALGEPANVAPSSSDNLSFTSGHTAVAFAITVSAARVMTLRRYGRAGWVWGLGLPAAAAVGCFRIAADRHYLTDVLAAAGIGTAVGLIVPRLVFTTRPAGPGPGTRVTIAPLVSGSMLGVSCTW